MVASAETEERSGKTRLGFKKLQGAKFVVARLGELITVERKVLEKMLREIADLKRIHAAWRVKEAGYEVRVRRERGTWEKEEFERELRRRLQRLVDEEEEFRYRRNMGLVCYKTATAKTFEEIMDLVKHGWELVHEANGIAIFRKPLKEAGGV